MPDTILAIPFNRKLMESRKISVKIARAGYSKTTIDSAMAIKPKTMSRARNQPGAFI
jgi:hypothetical protein